MKRTRVSTILLTAVLGGAAAVSIELFLVANGRPMMSLPITLGIALAAIGGIVVSMAIPILRMTRSSGAPRVDPFYATRVVMLAKACTITGALAAGVSLGVLAYLLTRSIVSLGSVGQTIVTVVGAGALLAGGLIAEYMCRIPPSDDDNDAAKDRVTPGPATPYNT